MSFHVSSPLLSFLLPLLLSKSDLRALRRYIWKRRSITVYTGSSHNEYSLLFLHPLSLLHYGISPGQICKVSFSVRREATRVHSVDRLLRIQPDSTLPIHGGILSSFDVFNAFGHQPILSLSIKKMTPYSRLPESHRLVHADTLKVAAIIQPNPLSIDENGGIASLLRSPRIVYNGDLVSISVSNPLEGSHETVSYKLDCSPHPSCLVDSSVSVYETSSIHSLIPTGSSSPLPPLPPSVKNLLNTLTKISYAHSQISNGYPLSFLLHGPSGSGKRLLAHKFASSSHKNIIEVNSLEIWSEVSSQGEQKLKAAIQKAISAHPCVLYLSNVDGLGYDPHTRNVDSRIVSVLRNILEDSSKSSQLTIVMGCTTKQLSNLSQSIRELVLYEYSMPSLTPIDRVSYLGRLLKSEKLASVIAKNTSGFVLSELLDLVADSHSTARENGRVEIRVEDVEKCIERRNSTIASSVQTAKVPSVSWDDIGGLEESKKILQESLAACLQGGRRTKRSGIILFGSPGCGKTLLAKAVATQYKIAFLSVKGPELLNKYVGQSEENLRNVFERAREASPCVIFFDELDSIAPNRGRHGDSGGVMDRIVSQLLSELDDLQSREDAQVFVMGATNRADLLDEALLSPGRFDKIIHVSPGQDVQSKKSILEAVSRSVQLDKDVDMEEIASSCPAVMSGAELYSIVSNATMGAIREQVSLIESGQMNEMEADFSIRQRHLLQSLAQGRHIS